MNKSILIGRLVRDPEMRTTPNGVATTSFTVAVSRAFANQNGEREADFINCVAWRRQAETIAKYFKKGSQIALEGRIQTRSYDAQDGSKRYITEVVVDNFTFIGSRADGAAMPESSNTNYGSNPDITTTDVSEDPFKDFGEEVALSDDDLPF